MSIEDFGFGKMEEGGWRELPVLLICVMYAMCVHV